MDRGHRSLEARHATQGYFNIADRDPFSPEQKSIRVVTTIQFFLVDD